MDKRPRTDDGAFPRAFRRRLRGKQASEDLDGDEPSASAQDLDVDETFPSAQDACGAHTDPARQRRRTENQFEVIDVEEDSAAFQHSVCACASQPSNVRPSASSHSHDESVFSQANQPSVPEPATPILLDGPVPLMPSTPVASMQQRPTSNARENDEQSQAIDERWFFGMGTKIVGVQHYNGIVSDRESVVLCRQPTNPYDRNAIQVLNVRNEQIGHLPREMAAQLAPFMDQHIAQNNLEELRFEGHIPRGARNTFKIPLKLAIFGCDPARRLAPLAQGLANRLRHTYCASARGSVEIMSSPDSAGTPVGSIDDKTWTAITGVRPGTRSSVAHGPSMGDIIDRELEGIFRLGACYESMPEAEPPTALRTELYPHQRKALHWMLAQERDRTVDEALLDVPVMQASPVASSFSQKRSVSKSVTSTGAQVFFWTRETLQGGGVVYRNLATNSAFRAPPRLPRGGILADDMGLGKTVTVLSLILADSFRGTGIAGKPPGHTLVVCPLSVVYNWSEQIRLHAPSLRVQIYHGSDRNRDSQRLAAHDVTVTTYDTVRAETKDPAHGLGAVFWHRAVLDEAHTIKSHRTATAQAIFDIIKAERRWCLTGTPIQNSVEDIYSLARFLKLEPFDRQEWFNRIIVRPLKNCDNVGFERLQIFLRSWCLRRTKGMQITDSVTGLPRPLLMLPEKRVEVVRVPLDPGDRVLYDRLFNLASQRVKQLEDKQQLGQQFSHVLALLTRLRQLCCAPALLPVPLTAELRAGKGDQARVLDVAVAALGAARVDQLLQNLAAAAEDDCSICLDPGCDVVSRCGHVFHRGCIETVLKEQGCAGRAPCPLCRQQVSQTELMEKRETFDIEDETLSMENGVGAKVHAVMAFLANNVIGKVDSSVGKPHKAIVFSQFTRLLRLLQTELTRRKLPYVCLDGGMTHEKRVQALQAFSGHGHVQIILCSLKAAGTGLNLTVADHVLLIDPWWNPAVEDQAIDRAHRLGQRRPVRVLRYIAERTVEERILEVHTQKSAVMEGALGRKTREELQKLRFTMVSSIFEPFQ
mmetsp:Transcript_98320/g.194817  ORF Transcript_98320/g.194817 Transcript_98320/m.194817 type:complete len:1042 (-) Transcript_98320:237-3362(-)